MRRKHKRQQQQSAATPPRIRNTLPDGSVYIFELIDCAIIFKCADSVTMSTAHNAGWWLFHKLTNYVRGKYVHAEIGFRYQCIDKPLQVINCCSLYVGSAICFNPKHLDSAHVVCPLPSSTVAKTAKERQAMATKIFQLCKYDVEVAKLVFDQDTFTYFASEELASSTSSSQTPAESSGNNNKTWCSKHVYSVLERVGLAKPITDAVRFIDPTMLYNIVIDDKITDGPTNTWPTISTDAKPKATMVTLTSPTVPPHKKKKRNSNKDRDDDDGDGDTDVSLAGPGSLGFVDGDDDDLINPFAAISQALSEQSKWRNDLDSDQKPEPLSLPKHVSSSSTSNKRTH